MSKFKLNVSSSTYKKQIFEGFSRLQQSDEFVNMTLAAEGHLVKVHQAIVALASPYLKDMILSLPCQHPVIFLSGISHETLGFILEYIYRGEVEVPVEKLRSFLLSAQAMQIAGLRNINPPMEDEISVQERNTKLCKSRQHEIQSTSEATMKIQNDVNLDLQLQETLNVQPMEFNIDIPTSSRSKASQNLDIVNPFSTSVNIAMGSGDDNVMESENLTDGQLPCNIDIPIPTSSEGKESQNLDNMNPIDTSFNMTMDNSEDDVMESENQIENRLSPNIDLPTSSEENDESQKVRNINPCGKTISITLDSSECNDNPAQKPVAKIEILGHTIISKNIANDQGQLPQLYTEALASMKKQIAENSLQKKHSFNQLLNVDAELSAQNCNSIPEPAGTSINDEEVGNETDQDTEKNTDSLLYTASNRGALQLIMNRFMYYCHYTRNEGRKRRWRCIDYRDAHCPVVVDTVGEEVVRRMHKHSHPNHDQKIRKKIAKKDTKFFPTLQMAKDIIKPAKTDTKGAATTKVQKRDNADNEGTYMKCHCVQEKT